MSSQSAKEKLESLDSLPGLTPWHEKTVLLFRCSDIDKTEFLNRVDKLYDSVADLYDSSLPEAMEEDVYLAARDYYDISCDACDLYLSGLENLRTWAESPQSTLLEASKAHFARGDKLTGEAILLFFETQEVMKQADIALMKSAGIDTEGIE